MLFVRHERVMRHSKGDGGFFERVVKVRRLDVQSESIEWEQRACKRFHGIHVGRDSGLEAFQGRPLRERAVWVAPNKVGGIQVGFADFSGNLYASANLII